MSHLLDAAVRLDGVWWWLLLLLPMVWAARFAYGRTRPSVPSAHLTVLWSLRAAVFGLLILLLAEPVLSYLSRRALHPVFATLIDASGSMSVEAGGVTRLARIQQVLDAGLGQILQGPARAFSSEAHDLDLDTLGRLQPGGQATDISAALRSAFRSVPDARLRAGVVLLSDGRHNLGDDPVRIAAEQKIPVFALGVGQDEDPDDIQLVDITSPDSPFSSHPVQLQVHLRSWGFQDSLATLRLLEGDTTLTEATVRLEADGQVQRVALTAGSLSAGPHLLRVQILPKSGELTEHNNQSLLALRVRQNQLRVLLKAARPGPEVAFVARTLAADSTLQVDQFIQRDPRQNYRSSAEATSAPYDAVIVLAWDGDAMRFLEGLDQYVAGGAGLLLQAPAAVLTQLPQSWSQILPLSAASALDVKDDHALRLHGASINHPIHRSLMATGADPWGRLPPLLLRSTRLRARPAATIILETGTGDPVVAAGAYGSGRVIQVAGSGFWRQAMFGAGSGVDTRTVQSLWRNAVRWLALAEPEGRLRASVEQPVVRSGQPAVVRADVFDDFNEPLEGATVQLSLQSGERLVELEALGSGQYRGEVRGLAAGTHAFEVVAHAGAELIGTVNGTFIVETHTVETGDLRPDPDMLAAIASQSGGKYRRLEEWRDLLPELQVAPTLVRREQHLGLDIRQTAWLAALLALLTAEWIVRKRSGML